MTKSCGQDWYTVVIEGLRRMIRVESKLWTREITDATYIIPMRLRVETGHVPVRRDYAVGLK